MGKKGDNINQERPLSSEELRLLDTQNQQLQAGIAVAKQQDDRAQTLYDDWVSTYQPIETGMIVQGATRENGYSDPSRVGYDNRNLLFKSRQDEQDKYNGGGVYQSQNGEAPVENLTNEQIAERYSETQPQPVDEPDRTRTRSNEPDRTRVIATRNDQQRYDNGYRYLSTPRTLNKGA